MKGQHPDRDSLSAFLEEALSIDATQWIEHHLGGCADCRAKLEEERAFLAKLGSLCDKIEPPADFTESVMARVAQQPAHHPAPEVSWRRMGLWVASGAAALVVLLVAIGWLMSVAGLPEGTGWLAARVASAAKEAYMSAEEFGIGTWSILTSAGKVLGVVLNYVRGASLAVQLGIMLATVTFNYVLMRMVLNYQRRH